MCVCVCYCIGTVTKQSTFNTYKSILKIQNIEVFIFFLRGNTGLQSLSRELLCVEMDKAFHVQCGNWEAEELTERQVRSERLL